MISTAELQFMLTIHTATHADKNGRVPWYADVSRSQADRLIKLGLITRENDGSDDRYCTYKTTESAEGYITFIKELIDDNEEGIAGTEHESSDALASPSETNQ